MQGLDVVLPSKSLVNGQVAGQVFIVASLDSAAPASELDALDVGGFGSQTRVEGLCCRIFPRPREAFLLLSTRIQGLPKCFCSVRRPGVWAVNVGGGRSYLGMFSTVFRFMLCCCATGRHYNAGGVFRLTCGGSVGFLGHRRSFFCTKSFWPFSGLFLF